MQIVVVQAHHDGLEDFGSRPWIILIFFVFVFETVLDMFPKRFSCVSPDCRLSVTMLSGVLLEVFSMFMRRGIKYRRGGGFYVYYLDLCVISCRRIVLARVIY